MDGGAPPLQTLRFGRFRLDPAARRLSDEQDVPLPLSGRAYDVLEHLLRHRDRVVGKDELLAAVWPRVVVEENNLTQAISALRRTLGDSRDAPEYIATVAGRGYRFIARVHEESSAAATDSAAAQPAPAAGVATPRSRRWWAALVIAATAAIGISVWRREPPPPRPDTRPTIAVLPFPATTPAPDGEPLAQIVTTLLHDQLARRPDARVIGMASANVAATPGVDAVAAGRRLQARYVLQGRIAHESDRLRIDTSLVDTADGTVLWSDSTTATPGEIAALRVRIATTVATRIGLATSDAAPDRERRINLDAYALYLQGRRLLAAHDAAGLQQTIALQRRATILDPEFARGYLALAQAESAAADLRQNKPLALTAAPPMGTGTGGTPALRDAARQALDRALELDPGLGEAWIERAATTRDAATAEALYRKGLALAPSDANGYLRFSDFLFRQYRKGEAIDMIDRARALDPLNPLLHTRKAFLLMVERSDVAGHDRLLQEALTIDPRFLPALMRLVESQYEYHGEFAAAAHTIERVIALDPQAQTARASAARIYLDADDPGAADAVVRGLPPGAAAVEIALNRREHEHAAQRVRDLGAAPWALGPIAPLAEAIRDEAIARHDFAPALGLLEAQYRSSRPDPSGPRMWARGLVIVLADALIRAGNVDRGRDLARSMLVQIDAESVGRAPDWFSRERASLYALLGDDERALAELEASAHSGKRYRWRYLAEQDPVFARLRRHPRFIALAEQMSAHRAAQRALIDAARRKGELPARGA